MNLRVLFFASLKDATGTAEVTLDLTEEVSLDGLIEKLAGSLPATGIEALRAENIRIAINQTLTRNPVRVAPGDEVAFMPPVTGG